MQTDTHRFFDRAASWITGITRKQPDINQHILDIHSQMTLDGLVSQAALSMKAIFDYTLFAFVLEEHEGLHVWSDPLLSKARIVGMVEKDFPDATIQSLRYISKGENKIIGTHFHKPDSVLCFPFSKTRRNARLYLTHTKQLNRSENHAVATIIASVDNALGTLLKIRELEKTVDTDPLTGCYNRRALNTTLDQSIHNAKRYKRDLSLVMMDIDFFKSFNDIHGHLFGDEVLRRISLEVQGFIRKGDALARYGGEEFVIVLPETPLDMAIETTQRLREKIENLIFTAPDQSTIKITASFGVASVTAQEDRDSLLAEADAMLYLAKSQGRNCVMPTHDRRAIVKRNA